MINADVVFEGEAAHSARPWLGDNAVTKAGEFLTAMRKLEPELHVVEGLEFKEVISVTMAHGGIARNVIPSEFVMNVNYRFAPDRPQDEAISHLRVGLCRGRSLRGHRHRSGGRRSLEAPSVPRPGGRVGRHLPGQAGLDRRRPALRGRDTSGQLRARGAGPRPQARRVGAGRRPDMGLRVHFEGGRLTDTPEAIQPLLPTLPAHAHRNRHRPCRAAGPPRPEPGGARRLQEPAWG